MIASDITAGAMQVDAGRDFNVLSDKDSVSRNEKYSKKEIGVELTLNSEEASLFAGYWEEKNGQKSTQSEVASSNINAGSLKVNSKNTNVVGSNIAGQKIEIDSENIRVLSDTINSNTDAYTKSIKAGIEVGVKQNLSDTVDAVTGIADAQSGTAVVAQSLKAYDAVQSFAEQPVTAGVNAIYEESRTDTESRNSQVIGSSITATETLTLNATNELEIAGSDVGSAKSLTVNADNINIHASEGSYTTDTSSQNKNANVGLYGTRMGQATVGYQENEMSTEGTYQRNSQLYAGGRATVTSKQDTTLSGATIDANELTLNVGGDLTMESLQDTQVIDGSSKGGSISGSLITGTPTGASANGGKISGERAWVNEGTGINGRERIRVNVGGTTTLTGASITNIDEHGIDQGNLEVTTQHLVVKDIKDIDTYDASTAGIAVGSNDGAPSLNSVEYTNNTKDKEQITRATIGSGTLNTQTTTGTLNRETGNIQEITKEKSSNTELYVSNRTLDLVSDPTGEIEKLGQKLDDVGLAAHVEILKNLPSASKGKDGEGDLIDNTIGKVLDAAGTIGVLPSAENDGGYITQIATQLFGDNRAGIVVKDKRKLEAMTTVDGEQLRERQSGDKANEWDYEKVTLVKTKDGIKQASELKDTDMVETSDGIKKWGDIKTTNTIKSETVYRTNPDKQLVIEDGQDRSGNSALEDYKIRISKDDIVASGIDHLFTNGMFNDHDTAVYNQQTQQGGANAVLNYNQQHGVVGDLIEDLQDHLSVNGLDILTETVTLGQAEGSADGIGNLGTGGARQTGNLIEQMTTIREGDLTIGAHSQGTMMTQNGLDQRQKNISNLVQDHTDANFLVQYSGAPVNHEIAEEKITEIYGGEEGIRAHMGNDAKIDNVFRSQVAPEDFVGSVLGYQSAGINNSENLGVNMRESTLSVGRLFGLGGSSTHSYYGCIIGCGEENFTPDVENYYTPKNPNKYGDPQQAIDQYYIDNFAERNSDGNIKMDNGKPVMTINMDLLRSNARQKEIKNNYNMDLKDIQGDQ